MSVTPQVAAPIRAACIAIAVLILAPALAAAGRGDPDRSFGGDGTAQLPANDTLLRAAAVQRDGKLIAVGEQGREQGRVRLLVARFNRNGSLDRSFNPGPLGLPLLGGSGGTYVGAVGTTANAVAVQRDGKIVVAGSRTHATGTDTRGMLILRLNPNGTRDGSFSGNGVATALAKRSGEANAVALRGGRIVVAGAATLGPRSDRFARVAVARFRANGSKDRSFGRRGARVLDFGRLSFANAVGILRNGKIALAGSQRHNLQATELLAARLTARGSRDRRFSGDGVFVRQYARGAAYSAAFDLAPGRRGKVVLAGVAVGDRGSAAVAVRLTSRGRPDRGFSGDGAAYLQATRSSDQYTKEVPYPGAYGIARTGSGYALGGYFDNLGLKRIAVWGLKRNGRPDRGFGTKGRTVTATGRNSSQLSDLAPGGGGRLYGVGDAGTVVEPPNGLAARYQGRSGR
jgi:uncharacterized delta-60 repeat protein